MKWQPSSRSQIREYYREEFQQYQEKLPEFITPGQPKEYALAFRDPYPTVDAGDRPFIRRATRPSSEPRKPGKPVFDSFEELYQFIRHPADHDPLGGAGALADPDLVDRDRPVPEAVYYAADMWHRSWLLWVDIDAKDVARERASEKAPSADDPVSATGITSQEEPTGFPYAFEDVEKAIEYGFEVEEFFSNNLCGEHTMIVYSGQGCHVYLLDDDLEHDYDTDSREVINDVLTIDYEIPIDTVVTADQSRVARLPYSLHAGVSRIVTPIEDDDFDFRTDPVPDFLEQDHSDQTGSTAEENAIELPGETE